MEYILLLFIFVKNILKKTNFTQFSWFIQFLADEKNLFVMLFTSVVAGRVNRWSQYSMLSIVLSCLSALISLCVKATERVAFPQWVQSQTCNSWTDISPPLFYLWYRSGIPKELTRRCGAGTGWTITGSSRFSLHSVESTLNPSGSGISWRLVHTSP